MKDKLNKLPHTLHNLNNIFDKSGKFSHLKNKLFDNLVIPPGFCVNVNLPNSHIPYYLNNCNNCIDNELYLNLIKLVQENIKEIKTRKHRKKVRSCNTRKSKKY